MLQQLNFLGMSEESITMTKKRKKKNKAKQVKTNPQLSLFDVIIGVKEEEHKKIISEKPKKIDDFKITDAIFEKMGSIRERLNMNIQNIKLVKKLKSKNNFANFFEQEELVKFTGFGAMQDLFDEKNEKFSQERDNLKSILTPEEFKNARSSVNTAFYTDNKIIKFMYSVIEKLGFKGGDILEPSCGIGNFFGVMPKNIKSKSTLKGVEIDTLTGEIAKQLYQSADIEIAPFEESLTYSNYYDLVIGNVPFGNFGVFDKEYNKYNLSIHNYFIVKALDKLREGGLLAVITSKFTMDSKSNIHRNLITEKSKVVACFRLPKGAFKDYARTDAVTDIIILQKTNSKSYDRDSSMFLNIDDRGINKYYSIHPENILGELQEVSGMYGKELTPILPGNKTIEQIFEDAIEYVSENIYVENNKEKIKTLPVGNFDIKPGGYDFIDNTLVQNQNGYLVKVDKVKNTKNLEMYRDFVELKKHVHKVLQAQIRKCSDEALEELQVQLNVMYDRFVYRYQYIDSKALKSKFKEDPDYPLLCSLEIHSEEGVNKADIFFKRTIKNDLLTKNIQNAKDALGYCINKYGYVNLEFMKQIYKKDVNEILNELQSLIYLDPKTNAYILSDEYLSGNVHEKLVEARKASEYNDKFKENVKALERVQPVPLTFDKIEVKLGTTFIPIEYYDKFAKELFKIEKYSWKNDNFNVTYNKSLDEYIVKGKNIIDYSLNNVQWGTNRKQATELLESALNSKSPKVWDTIEEDGKERKIINKDETFAAESKMQQIKDEFKNWIYQDEERRTTIEKIYNDKYNSYVDKKYNGDFLTLPGKNPSIILRDYQKSVIARGIIENNSLLLFHHVGAGKSFGMMSIGMELKRLGICNKPLYVVPNHMVQSGQFFKEFLMLYPNAKLLAATSEDFSKENRMKLVSKIATCDWDGIVIGHSSLIKIPVSKEFQVDLLNKQLEEIEIAIREADDRMTVKRFETIKKNQINKLKKLKDIKQDNTLIFEELGIDQIFIDEAHNFKNLFTFSKMSNVAGVQTTSAQKTEDLYAKIQYIYSLRGKGKGVCFATGTPVSNSMSELYVMQKYLQPQILEKEGIDTFDRWASVFGEVINSIEISPTGKGFKQKQRFAKFYNTPELTTIFRQCADVVLKHQLNIPVPKANYHKIEIPAISAVEDYVNNVILPRAEALSNKGIDPSIDNMLKVTNDGRKAALDIRLIDPEAEIDGPTKISVCADKIYEIWDKTKQNRSTQLVFCDLGTPKTSSNANIKQATENDDNEMTFDETDLLDDSFYDVYHEIQNNLLEKGVPKEEIAFIHDAKTPVQRTLLINNFRSGNIRILLGSTSKMGEGMNAMDKIVSIHHIDVPWKPSSLEQRDGRGIRFGNENKEIDIYRYVTKGTFDAFSWQTVQTKANFIGQILCGMSNERNIDDVDVQIMNFAEMKAAASDNPLVLKKFELEVELKKLNILEKGFYANKYSVQKRIPKMKKQMELMNMFLLKAKKDLESMEGSNCKEFMIDNTSYELNINLIEMLTEKIMLLKGEEELVLGKFLNLEIVGYTARLDDNYCEPTIELRGENNYKISFDTDLSLLRRLSNFKEKLENKKILVTEKELHDLKLELKNLDSENDKSFQYGDKIISLKQELDDINKKLGI